MRNNNYWEYKNHYWEFPFYNDSSAHSIEIIGDTILPNGKEYKILFQKNIPDDGFSIRIYERIDSLTACIYRYSTDPVMTNNEYLVDSLLAKPGNYFAGSRTGYSSFGNGIFSTLCIDEYEDTVLSIITDVKEMQDQSFIPGENYTLAKQLGYVSSWGCEFSCGSTHLVYALIDGVEHGEKITNLEKSENITPTSGYKISQNYPNPFNPSTKIKYAVSNTQKVVIKIFDILGNEIATLVNEEKVPGEYEINFETTKYNLSSGVYFYQLRAGSFIQTKKMILMR
jgi:hypothetical protein